MKTTRLLSTVLLCLLALTACVDDDIKENYVFGSIAYSVEAATDGVSKRTIEIEPLELRNPTDQEQTVTVDPYPDDFRYIDTSPCKATTRWPSAGKAAKRCSLPSS